MFQRPFVRAVVTCLAGLGLVVGCRPSCEHEIRQSLVSPDGRHVATVSVENCHATSPFVTNVNIRRAADKPDPDDSVFAATGSIPASVTWVSSTAVVIRTDEGEPLRRESRWREISVTYEPLSAPSVEAAVPRSPSADAREVSPGVYVATLARGSADAPPIQNTDGFTLLETTYDAAGKEVAGSVPSTRWDLLSDSSKLQLAGMRKGEVRRVWTCSRGVTPQRCTVEDVELLEIDQDVAGHR